MKKIIIIGSDHNGTNQKVGITKFLKNRGYIVIDIGNYNENIKTDYNDIAHQLGSIVNQDLKKIIGILICGTGVGVNIVANKCKGIRSVLAHSILVASKSREHNDSNIISLGSWVNSVEENIKIVSAWLGTNFGQDRHIKRIAKIESEFNKKYKLGFLNGVFDIIHPGHVELIKFAGDICDKLVIGINSDISTRKIKGRNRPINNERDRKNTLMSFNYVNEVLIFNEKSPTKIINKIKPDVIIRGDDFNKKQVRIRDKINKKIEIKIFKKKPGYSTTNIISSVKKNK